QTSELKSDSETEEIDSDISDEEVDEDLGKEYKELKISELKFDRTKPIAKGAFGVVYKGTWHGIECAIKELTGAMDESKVSKKKKKKTFFLSHSHFPCVFLRNQKGI